MSSKNKRNWGLWVGIIAASVGVAFILGRIFLYEPFRIPSGAMRPTLEVGDFIMVYKWPYGRYGSFGVDFQSEGMRSSQPKRGEIFVFKYPRNPEINYVKRVVGLPGDKIRFDGQQLFINGVQVEREQLSEYAYSDKGLRLMQGHLYSEAVDGVSYTILLEDEPSIEPARGEVAVPPGQYFVMGDNRDNSSDSRYWGLVPEGNIVGKAVWIWMSGDERRVGPIAP